MNFSSTLSVLPGPPEDCLVNTNFYESNVLEEFGWGFNNINEVNEPLISESPNFLHCASCNKYKIPETQEEIALLQSQGMNGNYYICEQCCTIHDMKLQITELTNQIHELNDRVNILRNIQSSEREIDNSLITHLTPRHTVFRCQNEESSVLANRDLSNAFENVSNCSSVNSTRLLEFDQPIINNDANATSQSPVTENQTNSSVLPSAAIESQDTNQNDKNLITEDDKRIKYIFTGDKCISKVHVTNQINMKTCYKITYRKNNLKQTLETVNYLLKSRLKNVSKIILQIGVNDIKGRGSESIKHDLKEVIKNIHKMGKDVIISGPFPTPNMNSECFSRMVCINDWLVDSHSDLDIHFIDNFDLMWNKRALFVEGFDVLNNFGSMVLSNNIRSSIVL